MPTTLCTVHSRDPRDFEDYYHPATYFASLKRLGVEAVVLGYNEWWEGLMTKAFRYRDWLKTRPADERVILTDCWDVILTKHPDIIGDECAKLFGDAIVFNGERGCWPRGDLAEHFPDGGTPWRYLNCGVMCGPAGQILKMFESMNLEAIGLDRPNPNGGSRIEPNDQGEIQAAFVKQPVPMVVDTGCKVFQCFSGCEASEFAGSGRGVTNKLTQTQPGVLHFNGNSKNLIMPDVVKAMGL